MFGDLHSLQAAEIDSYQGEQAGTVYGRRAMLQVHKGKKFDDGSMGTNPETLQIAHGDHEAAKL